METSGPVACTLGTKIENGQDSEIDPLSYLNRNEFTSEKYKIEIRFVLQLGTLSIEQCNLIIVYNLMCRG